MKRILSIILSTIILIPVLCSVVFAASDYNSYRAETDNLNKLSVPLQGQCYRVVKDGNVYKSESKNPGICNIVAATQLLNRRLAYDNGSSISSENAFTMSDIISACGNTVTAAGVDFNHIGKNNKKYYGNGYEYYGNGTSQWYNYTFTAKNGARYNFIHVSKPTMTQLGINTEKKFNDYLASILLEHPEGVHYRGQGHCIVFTDFIKNGDNYTFYAIDGVDELYNCLGRQDVTKTWQYKYNGVENFYASMSNSVDGYIAYIDAPKKPAHTCPTTPKNDKGEWNFRTDGLKLGVCKVCGNEFDWFSTLEIMTDKKATIKSSKTNYKVNLYEKPYEDAKKETFGKVLKEISILGTVKNAYGNSWYAVKNQDGKTEYIYKTTLEDNYNIITSVEQERVKYDSGAFQKHTHDYNFNNGQCYCGAVKSPSVKNNPESTLKINLTRYPVQHTQGNNFGLRGTISSNYKIKKIYGYIKQNGSIIQSTEDTPNVKSVNVKEQRLNNNLVFETLGAGNYILEVKTVDASGNGITVTKNFFVVGQSAKAESNLSINLDKYPVTLNAGSGFGLRGSVTSNYNIAAVNGYVVNANGSTVLSSKDTPNSTYMDIRYANLNNDLVFNNLGAGNYVMRVVATDNSGRTVEVSKNFTVVSNSVNSNSDLSINLDKYPVSLELGSSYGLRGSITSNYNISVVKGYVYNSNGQTVLSSVDYPNSTYMDIRPARLNEDLIFNNLTTGNYTMKVVAVDASGRTVEATKNFTVKSKAAYVDNSPNGNGVTGTVVIPSSWDNLSIRTGPSTNYQIIGSMNNGAKCTVYPNKTINGWYYVNYNGIWGYASGRQINLNSSNSASVNTRSGIVNIPSSWDDLSIRTGPSTNYQIVGGMPQGARCTVYPDKAQNGWYYVEYNGVQGYAAGNRINLQ